MFPAARFVFAAMGAILGANIAAHGEWFFDALSGACIGFILAELAALRARTLAVERQIAALRDNAARRGLAAPAAAGRPTTMPMTLDELRRDEAFELPTPVRAAAALPGVSGALVNALRGFLTGGNALVRVGVIVLFFGVAFLLRYAAEHTRVPVVYRLAGVATGAFALLALGWRLRKSRPGYALAVQGGAVGILYLIVFVGLRLYAVFPASAAFTALAMLAGLSAALAVLQDSLALALLAVTGGFLAPILASIGIDNHVVLFSYYAVLNAGIVAIAWFKAWRPLNLAGFTFTFVIATVWGVLKYRAEEFSTTEPFLVLFFIFYVSVAVLFNLRSQKARDYVDATLVFGLPLIAFGLQSAMLRDHILRLACSATIVGVMYLLIAWCLHRADREARRVLIDSFVALGVSFLTLAVPLAFDARWNAASWSLEGSALIWLGCRQQRVLPRLFGAILVFAAGCVIAQDFDWTQGRLALKFSAYLGVLTISAASVFSARTLHACRPRPTEVEELLATALFLWGLFWWSLGGSGEIVEFAPNAYAPASVLGFAAATAWLSSDLYRRTQLEIAKTAALCLLPVMAACAVHAAVFEPHPLAHGGWVAWPSAFAIFYVLARRHEGVADGTLARGLHAASAWLLCALVSWECAWAINTALQGSEAWRAAAWAIPAAIVLICLPRCVARVDWPFRTHRGAYLVTASIGLAAYLGLWSLTTNLALSGEADPLAYMPLLNPLDLAQALVLVAMLRYEIPAGVDPRLWPACVAGLAFIWANGVLLRTLHQWAGVPFSLESFAQSTLVQTALSIFWALLALALMLIAARRHSRTLWLVGAGVLAVVVAKLFLVDLSRVGSVERIVSFVGVGLLMLIVGYLSPLPPAGQRR